MRLLRFNEIDKLNEEQSFFQKLEEDDNISVCIKGIVSRRFDHGFEVKAKNKEEFQEWIQDVNIYDTDLIPGGNSNLDLDQQIDLCIYGEAEHGITLSDIINSPKYNDSSVSWDDLAGIIADEALNGLNILYNNVIIDLVDDIDDFIKKYKLSYSDMKSDDPFGYYPSTGVNGAITKYRGLDNTPTANYNVYRYYNKRYNLELFFVKKV